MVLEFGGMHTANLFVGMQTSKGKNECVYSELLRVVSFVSPEMYSTS
jgi:hypothetical protein